ncbi:hypothetical protein SAMN05660900_01203 [Megasphaera cerevisiae DSM 20462]|jgi:hypothetical protein|nr:hypothetical protein SAMN05660900_01203 [Megasphaera cerevisiae DSM 20462]
MCCGSFLYQSLDIVDQLLRVHPGQSVQIRCQLALIRNNVGFDAALYHGNIHGRRRKQRVRCKSKRICPQLIGSDNSTIADTTQATVGDESVIQRSSDQALQISGGAKENLSDNNIGVIADTNTNSLMSSWPKIWI